jgi:hypothetical protein
MQKKKGVMKQIFVKMWNQNFCSDVKSISFCSDVKQKCRRMMMSLFAENFLFDILLMIEFQL